MEEWENLERESPFLIVQKRKKKAIKIGPQHNIENRNRIEKYMSPYIPTLDSVILFPSFATPIFASFPFNYYHAWVGPHFLLFFFSFPYFLFPFSFSFSIITIIILIISFFLKLHSKYHHTIINFSASP